MKWDFIFDLTRNFLESKYFEFQVRGGRKRIYHTDAHNDDTRTDSLMLPSNPLLGSNGTIDGLAC